MIIGVPSEIKDKEKRVAMTPNGVDALVRAGHQVLVQQGAGQGSAFEDADYTGAGAQVVAAAQEVFSQADMILKVKEPQAVEVPLLRPRQILFTYLHLAAEPELTEGLAAQKVTGVAYETVELPNRMLPLLMPMSEVAGRMSVQVAAHLLEHANGGRGKLLGGVPGVRRSIVTIIGGGTVGTNAAKIALGMGAEVFIIDSNLERLRYLDDTLHGSFQTLASNPANITEAVRVADVVIGAVLIPGAKAPRLVTKEMVDGMKPGAVIVDVAVDQGGCIETIKPTTHSNPTYLVNGVVHYGVTNMPGAVPRTSTYALTNATLPYALKLANLGFEKAVRSDAALARGVNTLGGHVTYKAVADAFEMPYQPLEELL